MIGVRGRRGLLHCYVREHFLMTAREKADVVAKLVESAKSSGFEVGKIFLERVESVPEAYAALLDAAAAEDVVAVLMPSLRHLDGIGEPKAIAKRLAVSAQVEVLLLPQSSFSQGPAWSSAVRDASSWSRPFPWSPGVVRTSSGHCTGTPSNAGERAHSNRAVSRSPFHPEMPMRVSRSASLPPEAPAWGQRGARFPHMLRGTCSLGRGCVLVADAKQRSAHRPRGREADLHPASQCSPTHAEGFAGPRQLHSDSRSDQEEGFQPWGKSRSWSRWSWVMPSLRSSRGTCSSRLFRPG